MDLAKTLRVSFFLHDLFLFRAQITQSVHHGVNRATSLRQFLFCYHRLEQSLVLGFAAQTMDVLVRDGREDDAIILVIHRDVNSRFLSDAEFAARSG